MAQRMRKAGHLGAAYFCRYNDGTRNDPRYLLGTVARQLCNCNTQYKVIIGGESGVKMLLGNSKLGVRELFTKLLEEPLSNCLPCSQRKLVIIDALDETEYESREDFLDLIMYCFPLLPEWLVFFITSRPEDSVQFRLKKYNPCVKICAGDSDQDNFYQQHEQDIQTFLKNKIDFSRLSVTVEDISKTCNGLFLYAHYIVEELRFSLDSGKELNQLSDLFPGDIDRFFLQNFKRVSDQVGQDIFKKLFGCAIVSPAPLPVSMISYILKRENSNHDEQQVIDAVSEFVVLRTSDQTLTFLHNLIPAWLTDKNKALRKLLIDKKIAGEYLGKIFVEILSSIVKESRPTCLSTDADLKDYVSCIAVRVLCQNGSKDSLKAVFDWLTSYHFIERRMQSGRIEIYHLLDDLRLAASCLSLEEVWKQEILQEILFALESNVLVLLECPHLLHSCLRNASNAVQETVSIPQVCAPWLERTVYPPPDANIADMKCFATSPNRRTVAGAQRQSLLFFDAFTAEKVSGPFDLSKDVINGINYLEFSPDGKFLFFGRLDKWFSVERTCVEDFPQFSGNSCNYIWLVFAPKGHYIVVKSSFLMSNPTESIFGNQCCLLDLVALWALKEIEKSRDDEMTVRFCIEVLSREPGIENEYFYHHQEVSKYLGQIRGHLVGCSRSCYYCSKVKEVIHSNQEPSLATVRQLVIELYPFIFHYQVWDLQTGMPVLQQHFSEGIQLNPFTYLFHVTCAFSECEPQMSCSGIEEAMSVCNIAVVNAFVRSGRYWSMHALELDLKKVGKLKWSRLRQEVKRLRLLTLVKGLGRELEAFWDLTQELKQERKLVLRLQLEAVKYLLNCDPEEARKFELKIEQKRKGEHIMSAVMKEFHNEEFKLGVCEHTRGDFRNLVYDVNEEIRICVSPEVKWIEAGHVRRIRLLQTGNQVRHFLCHGNPERIVSKFTHVTFTNDDLYLVYSCEHSLHALTLQTGTVLTSVSGFNLMYLTRERQVGYLFRSDTEERAILLTSLINPFKFLAAPSLVGKSIGAIFHSSNTVLSVSSDSIIMFWEFTADKKYIAFTGKPLLTASLPVKNCLLSSDGRLIAIHQKTKVELYSVEDTTGDKEFLYAVYESNCEFTVACFSFSADSTLLLFCVQDSRRYPYLYVWDVQQKVMTASLKSPGLLTIECCCFSWDKRLVILCGDYEIEILEYAKDTCRRLGVERPYQSVKFGQCTVSLDNQLLVCCIANRILIYNLVAPNGISSKQALCGHLGRIEFCRFLKVNRYLISYGVDGMVFLWDISELKAVAFARITQGKEKIVAMAVSPEEDLAVCFTSSGRVCTIQLCGLGAAPSLKPLTSPSKGELETAQSSLQIPRQIASTSTEVDMAESSSSSASEEDMNDYYQEHDDDVYFM